MAIALVSAGPVAQASAASLTPSFGQATTAGNLLVARLVWTASGASATTTASGWTQAVNTSSGAAVWYKQNCGAGETAPTFTVTSGTFMAADLIEVSGALIAGTIVDRASSGGFVASTGAADTTGNDMAVAVVNYVNTKSATVTFADSWAPTPGTVISAQGTGGTKQSTHGWFSAYVINGGPFAGVDTDTWTATPSTGASAGSNNVAVSFKPAALAAPATPTGLTLAQAYNNKLTISWTDETTGNPTSIYNLERSLDNTNWSPVQAAIPHGAQSYVDNGALGFAGTPASLPHQNFRGIGGVGSFTQVGFGLYWPGGNLTTLSVYLDKNGSPTDNLSVTAYTDSSGIPGSALVTSATVAASGVSTGGGVVSFAFATTAISAQKVWFVFSRSGSVDTTNYVAMMAAVGTSTGPNYLVLQCTATSNNLATWTAGTVYNWYSFADPTLTVGTTYYYRLTASNTQGTATTSATSTAVAAYSKSNNFEGGTNGTTITTANSGGTSGDAFDSFAGNTLPKFTNAVVANGSLSGLFTAGSIRSAAIWNLPSTITQLYGRFYVELTGSTNATTFATIKTAAGATMISFGISASGQFFVTDSVGTTMGATSTTLVANTLYRIEFNTATLGQSSSGVGEWRIYAGGSATYIENSLYNGNFSGTPATITFSGASAVTTYIDEIALSDQTWLGSGLTPIVTGVSPTSAGSGTLVTISGSSLSGASAVTFGAAAATSYSVVSGSTITAVFPSGLTNGTVYDTTVTSGGVTSATSAADQITALAAVSQSRQEIFNTAGAVAQSRQELFNTNAAVTKARQELWNTNLALAQSRQELFNTLLVASKARQELWNTAGAVSQSRQELWTTNLAMADVTNYLWNYLQNGPNYRSGAVATGSTTVVFSKPAGLADGDVLWVVLVTDPAGTVTPPSGWSSSYTLSSATNFRIDLFTKPIVTASGEASTYSFATGSSVLSGGSIIATVGGSLDQVLATFDTTTGTTITAPTVTTVAKEDVFRFFATFGTSAVVADPTVGPTLLRSNNNVSAPNFVLSFENQSSAGATGTRSTTTGSTSAKVGLTFTVTGTTPVSKAIQDLWNTLVGIAQSRQELWNTPTRVTQTRQELFNTNIAISQARQELWNTNIAVSKARQELWNTVGRLLDITNYVWNANSVVTLPAQELWNVNTTASKARQELWNVLAPVAQSRQELWNQRSIAAQTRQELFNTLAIINDDTNYVWNVDIPVSRSRQELWNVNITVSKARQELWNTLLAMTDVTNYVWNELALAAKLIQYLFTVFDVRITPDGLIVLTNLTGSLGYIQEDPASPDANYLVGSGAIDLRTTFTNPDTSHYTNPVNRQKFRILVRTN